MDIQVNQPKVPMASILHRLSSRLASSHGVSPRVTAGGSVCDTPTFAIELPPVSDSLSPRVATELPLDDGDLPEFFVEDVEGFWVGQGAVPAQTHVQTFVEHATAAVQQQDESALLVINPNSALKIALLEGAWYSKTSELALRDDAALRRQESMNRRRNAAGGVGCHGALVCE
jgi:hypothetical protein